MNCNDFEIQRQLLNFVLQLKNVKYVINRTNSAVKFIDISK